MNPFLFFSKFKYRYKNRQCIVIILLNKDKNWRGYAYFTFNCLPAVVVGNCLFIFLIQCEKSVRRLNEIKQHHLKHFIKCIWDKNLIYSAFDFYTDSSTLSYNLDQSMHLSTPIFLKELFSKLLFLVFSFLLCMSFCHTKNCFLPCTIFYAAKGRHFFW